MIKRLLLVLLGVTLLFGYSGPAAASGASATGWALTAGKWHYYDHGVMKKGWVRDGSRWYYLDQSGTMVTGWVLADGKWYYMAQSGAMRTGWVQDGGRWYYLDSSGAMKTGWVQDGAVWYYLDKSGVMKTGWVQDGGRWYFLTNSGIMKTGWTKVTGKWYYFANSGVMQTGWLEYGNSKYYLDPSGVMATGWRSISGEWYYFGDETGVMVRKNFVNGYYLMGDGRMTNAGSMSVAAVVDLLKKSIDVGISQPELQTLLGSLNHHELVGIEGESYWFYPLKVIADGAYQSVAFAGDDVGAEDLAKGAMDVILLVYWDADGKAFQVSMDYFNDAHKFHHYSSYRYDYEYN